MKTKSIPNSATPIRSFNHCLAVGRAKRFLPLLAGALLTVGAMFNARAQTVYSINIVGCVSDRTTYLLTAPLTVEQRQALHAQNFKQLAPSDRALYLHAVAYSVGIMVGSEGEPLSSAELTLYLQSVSSIYEVPVIPPDYSELAAAHLAVANSVLEELNVRIADQIANNAGLRQAMHVGTVCSLENILISGFENLSDLSDL